MWGRLQSACRIAITTAVLLGLAAVGWIYGAAPPPLTRRYVLPEPGHLQWGQSFSPDGALLTSIGPGGRMRVHDAGTGRPLHRFESANVRWPVAHSPDGRWLARVDSGATPNRVRVVIVERATGAEAARLDPPGDFDGLTFGRNGASLRTLVRGPAVTPEGGGPASRSWSVADWDLPSGEPRGLRPLPIPPDPFDLTTFDRELRRALACVDGTGRFAVWDVATGLPSAILDRPDSQGVARVALAGDRAILARGDGVVEVYDARTGRRLRADRLFEDGFRPFTVTADLSGRVALCLAQSPGGLTQLDSWVIWLCGVLRIAWRPTPRPPASERVLWDLATGRPIARMDCDSAALSPDGRLMAVNGKGRVTVWEIPR